MVVIVISVVISNVFEVVVCSYVVFIATIEGRLTALHVVVGYSGYGDAQLVCGLCFLLRLAGRDLIFPIVEGTCIGCDKCQCLSNIYPYL